MSVEIVRPGSTIYCYFDTFKGSDGSSLTMSGLALGDIQVYKDGSVTQRASTAGMTLLDTDGIDFDAVTGIHGFKIDLSDDTTADFWKAGSHYVVVVSSITVDAVTVNFVAKEFRIGYPGAVLDTYIATLTSQTIFTLQSGPAEDDALNGMEIIVHDKASGVQLARGYVIDYTGATKSVNLANDPTFTIAAGDNISVLAGAGLQPTVAGRRALITSDGLLDVNVVKVGPSGVGTAQTARDLGATLGAAGAGLTAIPFPFIVGGVSRSGSTYFISYALQLAGVIITTGLSALSITFYDEDGTNLTFSGTPAAGATGIIAANGTLTTPLVDNRVALIKVAVTYSSVAYTAFLPAISVA